MPRSYGARAIALVWIFIASVGWLLNRGSDSETTTDSESVQAAQLQQLREEVRVLRLRLGLLEDAPHPYPGFTPVTAQVVSRRGLDPYGRSLLIDAGSQSGVRAGQGVVAETGVVGVVRRVYPSYAWVQSVDSAGLTLTARLDESEIIYRGSGRDARGRIEFAEATVRLEPADPVTTSTASQIFPPGIAIGRIAQVRTPWQRSPIETLTHPDEVQAVVVLIPVELEGRR